MKRLEVGIILLSLKSVCFAIATLCFIRLFYVGHVQVVTSIPLALCPLASM